MILYFSEINILKEVHLFVSSPRALTNWRGKKQEPTENQTKKESNLLFQ